MLAEVDASFVGLEGVAAKLTSGTKVLVTAAVGILPALFAASAEGAVATLSCPAAEALAPKTLLIPGTVLEAGSAQTIH